MTVDGFGAAVWEKYAQSQGFSIFGPGRAWRECIAWGGGGSANREKGFVRGPQAPIHPEPQTLKALTPNTP